LEQRPELLDGYLATLATEKKLSAKTRANHVSTLSRVFGLALRWTLIRSNPVDAIEKPRFEAPDTVVLDEVEIGRLLTAYRELEEDDPEDVWLPVVRRMVVVGLGTALRRGELQGLRWGDCGLLEGLLRVRQQFTRGQFTTPKSRASRRVVAFGPKVAEALEEQWNDSLRCRDEDLVFGYPHLGTPLDGSKLGTYARKGAEPGGDREARPAVARPPPHGADLRRRGRTAERIRSGEGGPFAVHHHRALRPCRASGVPGCGRAQRGAPLPRPGLRRSELGVERLLKGLSLSIEALALRLKQRKRFGHPADREV